MLTLARALARKPRLLLADELSLGLAPIVVDRLLQAVRNAADQSGLAVMMVEQHAHKALKYADRAIVLRRGRVELDLSGAEARRRIDEVEQAYLSSGSIENPKVCAISLTRASAVFSSSRRCSLVGSTPSTMFSATVITGISMKCWCTIPIPAEIASFAEWNEAGRPLTRISPSSGL